MLVAFTVDPLYHQTSAQFDEGGAKGLLLSNLGVYGGCRVLFDSFEVPEISITSHRQAEQSELIDLSFAKGTDAFPLSCLFRIDQIAAWLFLLLLNVAHSCIIHSFVGLE